MKTILLQSDNLADLNLLMTLAERLGVSYSEIEENNTKPNADTTDLDHSHDSPFSYTEEDIWKLALQYPRDKKWVYEDLHSIFPQDLKVKVEIIQNELYINHQSVYDNYSKQTINMAAPNLKHQRIIKKVTLKMNAFVEEHDLGEVFLSPIDVKFDKDHSFQPDIVFVAKINYDILQEKAIEGSPDLVVEVISPSNHKKEMENKKATYEKFGVSEYWIIRPKDKSVRVEVLDKNGQYKVFKEATEKGSIESKILEGFEVNVEDIL